MGETKMNLLKMTGLILCLAPVMATAEIPSAADATKTASFDILSAKVTRSGGTLTFQMTTSGTAGAALPAKSGALAGAGVFA
jgi:hypothetical protein